MQRFEISAERSTMLISARSSVGPIVFEARDVTGDITAVVADGAVATEPGPTARLDIDVRSLRSGNDLYDAELARRIDARRHPSCVIDLNDAKPLDGGRFALEGSLTFHGRTRPTNGTVEVKVSPDGRRLSIIGEKAFDIRDFDLPAPSILMLKIYPAVTVQIFLEASRATEEDTL